MKHKFLIGFIKNMMVLSGLWPAKLSNPTTTRLYKIYANAIHIMYTVLVLTLYMILPHLFKEEPAKLFDQFVIIILYTTTWMKLFIVARGNVRDLIKDLVEKEEEGRVTYPVDEKVKEIYADFVPQVRRQLKGLICIVLSAASSFVLSTLYFGLVKWDAAAMAAANITATRPLLYDMWVPVDPEEHYYVLTAVISVMLANAVSVITTSDLVILSLIMYYLCELHLLRHHFRCYDKGQWIEGQEGKGEFPVDTKVVGNNKVYSRVKWLVKQHQDIIYNIEYLDRSVNLMMLLDFLTHSIQMASTLVLLSNLPFSFRWAWAFFYFFYVFIQLFLFYWYANEIQVVSEGIGEAIYDSDWHEQNKQVKEMLLVVMIRTQRSIKLHIGPLYDVSNEVLVKILKTFYSLLSILRNFNN